MSFETEAKQERQMNKSQELKDDKTLQSYWEFYLLLFEFYLGKENYKILLCL